MKTYTLPKLAFIFSLVLMTALALAGCQSDGTITASPEETQAVPQSNQTTPLQTEQPTSAPESAAGPGETDLASINSAWQSSPHAGTFVLDDQGQNNTCARCHAPVNWSPSIEELPESCFACKFELEEPAPLIPENAWANISCNVCHEVDKKGNVQPEYAWLEIAPLEEYTEVASSTELCLKCHAPVDIPNHGSVDVSGVHQGYDCTRCHSAHSTAASCNSAGCHGDTAIPAHDAYHQSVTCAACHDGAGMEVGLDEETRLWNTYLSIPTGVNGDQHEFTSHNIVLEVDCGRCHFAGNPWELSESVTQP